MTAVSGTTLNAEANLTFDGTNLDFGNVRIRADTHRPGLLAIEEDTGSWSGIQIINGSYEHAWMANSSGNVGLYNDNNNEWMIYCADNSYVKLYNNGAEKLETTSSGVTVSGEVNATSDLRLKKNVKTLENSLDKVCKLRGVEFDFIDTNKHTIGVIAQEVEKVLPDIVVTNEETDMKSVAYGNLTAVLIEAVKELKSEVASLKQEIKELKS